MRTITITIVALIIVVIGVYAYTLLRSDEPSYQAFTNEQFDYEIEYLTNFTPAPGVPENSAGGVFETENASLRVFGIENPTNEPLRTIAQTYVGESTSANIERQTDHSVTVRAATGTTTRAVRAIDLANNAVGVAILEYQQDALSRSEEETILQSFRSLRTVTQTSTSTAASTGTGTSTGTSTSEQGISTPDSGATSSAPVGFQLYQNSQLGIALLVPTDASISAPAPNRIQVTFLGPNNEVGTEIIDGFTTTIFRDQLEENVQSGQAYAQSVRNETANNPEASNVSNLREVMVNGELSYVYTYQTALGNQVTSYLFLPNGGNVGYQVTSTISDPENRNYESLVRSMLDSLQFRSASVTGSTIFEIVRTATLR